MGKWILVAVLLAGPGWAEGWKTRDGDAAFSAQALRDRLSGVTLVFYDEGRSVYGADGHYSYTYGGGGLWEGRWDVGADSTVCVTFVTNVTRCDRIVENAGQLLMLTTKGERFPIKP